MTILLLQLLPSSSVLIEKIYQTIETLFHLLSARRISTLFSLFGLPNETLSLMFDYITWKIKVSICQSVVNSQSQLLSFTVLRSGRYKIIRGNVWFLELQSKDVRIIIGLMYEDQFRQISCQVLLNNRCQYFASPAPQIKSLKAQNC